MYRFKYVYIRYVNIIEIIAFKRCAAIRQYCDLLIIQGTINKSSVDWTNISIYQDVSQTQLVFKNYGMFQVEKSNSLIFEYTINGTFLVFNFDTVLTFTCFYIFYLLL